MANTLVRWIHHPHVGIRWMLRILLVAAVLFAFFATLGFIAQQPLLLGLWIAGNSLLAAVAFIWSLFKPRAILPGFIRAAGWSFWLTLLILAVASSWVETYLAERVAMKFSYSTLFLGRIFLFLPLLVALFVVGSAGGACGAFALRKHPPRHVMQVGVDVFWGMAGLGVVLGGTFLQAPEHWAVFLGGLPVFTMLACTRLRGEDAFLPFQEASAAVSRRLVLTFTSRGRQRRLDLRGLVYGLLAGAAAMGVSLSGVLTPTQAGALEGLIRIWTEPLTSFGSSMAQFSSQETVRLSSRIVLLELDFETRRLIAESSSEAEVQARMIRKLKELGAAWIVLPEPDQNYSPLQLISPNTPTISRESRTRHERDLPRLEAAVRESKRVVLGVTPPIERVMRSSLSNQPSDGMSQPPEVERLKAAAAGWGWRDTATYGTSRLPALNVGDSRALPLVLHGLITGRPQVPQKVRGATYLDGKPLPTLTGERVLVSFHAPSPGQQFRILEYDQVFRNLPVYEAVVSQRTEPVRVSKTGVQVRSETIVRRGADSWVSPGEFLKGKVVFLDSLVPYVRETPIGEMPVNETTATALVMLQGRSFIQPVSAPVTALVTLLLAGLTGAWCTRRNPLQGGWRTLILAGGAFSATILLFLTESVWLDGITQFVGIVGAYLAVTQLTFNQEREQRQFWSRFVAPQLAERIVGTDFQPRLGGSRERICVLFADVRGFTRFAERTDPEEVLRVTNLYLGAMRAALFEEDGILDKYTGDGLMAFFLIRGDPEEGVLRAVRAAVAMRDAAERVSRDLAAQGVPPLGVGIGLNYGEAVVGLVGHEDHPSLTAVGHTVVVSQRLQSLAAGGQVIVSEGVTSFRSVQEYFAIEPREPVQMKGISLPVRPYQVEMRALPAPNGAAEGAELSVPLSGPAGGDSQEGSSR